METRKLPVKLTEDEITQRGRGMAKFESDRSALEESKKATADEFKAKINLCSESMGRLSRSINTGHEDRDVECEWIKNFARKVADLVRNDTGEVVETRPLDADELQEKLFPKAPERKSGDPKLPGMGEYGSSEGEEGLSF
jgi:hypothetical protein